VKINILRNSNEVLNGYINVDNFPGPDKVQCDVTNLDTIVDDSFATEIIAKNILEYYEYTKVGPIMGGWLKKLRHGGKITIVATDYRAVSRAIMREMITPEQSLQLLYGTQQTNLLCKKCSFTVDMLKSIFQQAGLNITNIVLANFQICITGERP
jgi:hypothetical protein